MVAVLQEIEQEKVSFEIFFTGHSIGGWLVQITTFTIEYLEVNGGIFVMKLKTEREKHLQVALCKTVVMSEISSAHSSV